MRERAHAVLLCQQEYSYSEIGRILMRDRNTISSWIEDWEKARMSSIFPAYTGNENAHKLTHTQKTEVAEVLKKPPSEQGLPGSFWSLPSLKNYIKAEFDIVYESERSYHYLLRYSGYSFKLPSPFDRRRDDQLVEARMKEIRKEIKPFLKNSDWEVLVQDECRVNWEEETRRAWLQRGEKTIVKLERNKHEAQSYFGALNQKNGKHHLIELDWQNTENTIKALRALLKKYPGKKLCIIWDNAKWHKSKELREQLKKGQALGRIHLIALPPYAPDENPQEHVWKEGKEKIANLHFNTFTELKKAFRHAMTGRLFNYRV